MVKHVFDNHMVAHIWAQQTQDSARSHNGNFHFEGATIYSYSTPVARIVESPSGARVALVTCETFSKTTNGKHLNPIWRALDYGRFIPAYTVPFIASGGRGAGRFIRGESEREIQESNLKHIENAYYEARQKALKTTQRWDYLLDQLREAYQTRVQFALAFELDYTTRDVESDIAEIVARWDRLDAKRNSPDYIAKRERERERREARELARFAESVEAWRKGESNSLYWQLNGRQRHNFPILLRVKGEEIETSRGATVPTRHAILAWARIKHCRQTATAWARNGSEIRVGHFQFDAIDSEGNVRAGCHFIKYDELARLAVTLGIESPSIMLRTESLPPIA